ncbi:MAG TPA: hypothetical protein V6D50_25050 [Chroococcales cyanobacterium]
MGETVDDERSHASPLSQLKGIALQSIYFLTGMVGQKLRSGVATLIS